MARVIMNDKIKKHLELKAINDNYFFENEFTVSELERICNVKQIDIDNMQKRADARKLETKKFKAKEPKSYAEYLAEAGLTKKVNKYF